MTTLEAKAWIQDALWTRTLMDQPCTVAALTEQDPALLAFIEAIWGHLDAALADAGIDARPAVQTELDDPGYDQGIGLRQWGSAVVGIYLDDLAPLPPRARHPQR